GLVRLQPAAGPVRFAVLALMIPAEVVHQLLTSVTTTGLVSVHLLALGMRPGVVLLHLLRPPVLRRAIPLPRVVVAVPRPRDPGERVLGHRTLLRELLPGSERPPRTSLLGDRRLAQATATWGDRDRYRLGSCHVFTRSFSSVRLRLDPRWPSYHF